MNEFACFTTRSAAGIKAYFRKPSEAQANVLRGEGGKEILFPTMEAALIALNKCIIKYVNSPMYRSGIIAGDEMGKAEDHFKKEIRRVGKSRVITVEYKGMKRRCKKSK